MFYLHNVNENNLINTRLDNIKKIVFNSTIVGKNYFHKKFSCNQQPEYKFLNLNKHDI